MRQHRAADDVAQRAADWNRSKKQRQNPTARLKRKQISQNGRRGGTVSAFTDTNENSGEKQDAESGRQARTSRRKAPENNREPDDDPAREPVRQPSQSRRDQHIGNEKSAAKNAANRQRVLVAGQEKRSSDRWFYGRQ